MGRPRKFSEQDVLATVRRQFNETGYHGTSVDDLSRATGLSKGSLYGAFGDKEALFQRIFGVLRKLRRGRRRPARRPGGPGPRPPANGSRRRTTTLVSLAVCWPRPRPNWRRRTTPSPTRSLAAYEVLLDSCRQLVEQAQRAGHLIRPPTPRRSADCRSSPRIAGSKRSPRQGSTRRPGTESPTPRSTASPCQFLDPGAGSSRLRRGRPWCSVLCGSGRWHRSGADQAGALFYGPRPRADACARWCSPPRPPNSGPHRRRPGSSSR